ncbi:MAG: IS256 family transposase [bacterium]|nr:IS256 family transposase [Hyphomicrobiales bacterium]MCP4967993.1 IS256 family transposase [bacterium]
MKKNRRNKKANQEARGRGQRTLWLASVIRENLYEFVVQEGMKALDTMLEQDRERLCGAAHSKGAEDDPVRWGATHGRLVMGGQRVVARKPRVRKAGKEVALPTWEQFADEDPLDERTTEQLVLGVSTRNYSRSVEPLPNELGGHGASKSAASRRFVQVTAERLEEWRNRDISDLDLVAIMLDGIEVGEQVIIVALGIDGSGEKHALGLWQGATENTVVCQGLVNDLVKRGLDCQQSYLFVVDGGKALRKAIREVFGKRSLVQRCQEHKRRNVLGHLPKRLHPSVNKAMRDAYRSSSRATAKRRLLQLVSHLADDHPDAAESLREGLEETLTLKDMKLPTWLERTLSTTNPIENLNGAIRRVTRNVKRWRDGTMVGRWVATAILEASRGFRKLRGYKGIPKLVVALRGPEQNTRVDHQEQAA